MIKLDVTSEKRGNVSIVKNTGKVAGKREVLAPEMAAVLMEFHSIDDGETLIIAFDMLMEEITHD